MRRVRISDPKKVITRLTWIEEKLSSNEECDYCPSWKDNVVEKNLCYVCYELFPKLKKDKLSCPCDLYTKPYLLRRVRKIKSYLEKRKNNKYAFIEVR